MDGRPDSPSPAQWPESPVATHAPRPESLPTVQSSLREPSVAPWTLSPPTEAPPPRREEDGSPQPAYLMRRPIGRGGMGEVWEAVQSSLGRVVAVKRLREAKSGDPAARWAFRHEALLSARLEHPNIVPVHDLGRDDTGAPLLAMKLVQGRNWLDLLNADWDLLAPAEFLARHLPILVDVAQAVAFAHSRGIVHRDIKPSQVMIGEFGETLLMDWGLGLQYREAGDAADGPEATPVLATPANATSPCGTPALMAPEQTEPTAENVGPWTDVYLLGGTLYFLLTRSYPHLAEDSRRAVEHARSGLITPPEERCPGRAMPPELRATCLRALQADPARRHASAGDLVRELREFLEGTTRRRAAEAALQEASGLLASQEPAYATLSRALALAEEARAAWPGSEDAVVLASQALEAHARRAVALGDLALARVQASRLPEGSTGREALLAEVHAAELAALRRDRTRRLAVAASFVLLVLMVAGAGAFTLEVSRQRNIAVENEALARAAEATALQRSEDARELAIFLLHDVTRELVEVVSPTDGRRDMTPEELRQAVLELRDDIGAEVIAHYEALDIEGDAPAVRQSQAEGMRRVAETLEGLGLEAQALVLARRAMDVLDGIDGPDRLLLADSTQTLGRLLALDGKLDEAEALLRRCVQVFEQLPEAPPNRLPTALGNLGGLCIQRNKLEEAEALLQRALELEIADVGRDSARVANTLGNLGGVAYTAGRYDQAKDLLTQSHASFEKALGASHPETITALSNLAGVHHMLGEADEAARLYAQAIGAMEEYWGPDHPRLASPLGNLGDLKRTTGHHDEAEALFLRALAIQEKFHGPDHPQLTVHLNNLALVLQETGRREEAAALLRRALAIDEGTLGGDHPKVALRRHNLGRLLFAQGEREEGLALVREAVQSWEASLPEGHPHLEQGRASLRKMEEAQETSKEPTP